MSEVRHTNTPHPVCPHCGATSDWGEDMEGDHGIYECDECGKEFSLMREMHITYSSHPHESEDEVSPQDHILPDGSYDPTFDLTGQDDPHDREG